MGNARNMVFWVVMFLMVLALFNLFSSPPGATGGDARSFSTFVEAVQSGRVTDAVIDGERVRYSEAGRTYSTIAPSDAEITNLLIGANVPFEARSQETSVFQSFIVSLLPFVLLIGVWIYFMNRMQGGGKGGAMGFGKSKAKLLT